MYTRLRLANPLFSDEGVREAKVLSPILSSTHSIKILDPRNPESPS